MESSPIYLELPKKKKHKEIRIAVCKAIDSFEVGQKMTGEMIQEKAAEFFPEISNKHLETIMRYMRAYRRDQCVCIDHYNGIYEKRAKEA
jgi:hypothetical protein